MRTFLSPVLILAGTIIGAGMFGLPFAFALAGFWKSVFLLLLLAGVIFLLHVIYTDIIVNIDGDHRLVGYARVIAGRPGAYVASAVNVLSLFGGLVVYLALGTEFFAAVTGRAEESLVVIWLMFSAAILFGTFAFRWFERVLAVIMIVLMAAIFFFGVSNFELRVPLDGAVGVFLLYGIGLFSFYGASALPEMKDYLISREGRRRTIGILAAGTFLPALAYLLFIVGIWGLSGGAVSEDALGGIVRIPALKGVGLIVGILSCMTSYWTLSVNLKNLIHYDYKIGGRTAQVIVLLAPVAVFMLINSSFLRLMGLVGSVAIGLEATLIIALYLMLRRQGRQMPMITIPAPLTILLFAIFGFGIVYVFLA